MVKAYRFGYRLLHPDCTARAVHDILYVIPLMEPLEAEVYLDRAARFKGVNRDRPQSFDVFDFPKRIEDNEEISKGVVCTYCGKPIR